MLINKMSCITCYRSNALKVIPKAYRSNARFKYVTFTPLRRQKNNAKMLQDFGFDSLSRQLISIALSLCRRRYCMGL